jgi:hypothetical protein
MDLDAYRSSAETFVSELTGAFYRHYAGFDDEYAIEPIYDRHASLFGAESVHALQTLTDRTPPGSDDRRRLMMLLEFAVDGTLGEATKALEAEVARREAQATIDLAGRTVGFRDAAVIQANEPDASVREEIERARLSVTAERLNPLYRELIEGQHEAAGTLGYRSYRELCERCKGIDLGGLARQTAAFAAATDAQFSGVLQPELQRRLGVGMTDLRRADLPRFFRAVEDDRHFPTSRLIDTLLETLRGLGIGAQENVELDVEVRPNKSPRAFCAPVRIPDEVYLVIAPVGGRDDYSALFHEAGHTQHYAHVARELPFEFRYLGDNSITEAFAFLFEHLVEDPEWLARRLDVDDPGELLAFSRAYKLHYLRRYCGKLAYELELHEARGSVDRLADRYSELLGEALQIEWPRQTYLSDVDPGFYSACYLRAWSLETHLRAHLRERFGARWFERSEAGDTLRSLWREGQRRSPEELLGELTGRTLSFDVLLDDLDLRH